MSELKAELVRLILGQEYTTELLNVLGVLTRLVAIEPRQAELLKRIVEGPTLAADIERASGALSGGSAEEAQDLADELYDDP